MDKHGKMEEKERHSNGNEETKRKEGAPRRSNPQKRSSAPKNALKTASELPYERFKRFGPENLTEIELLAIILRTGTRDNHVLQVAEEVMSLARYPKEGLLGLYDVTLDELMGIRGIGEVKAVRLKCLTELSMRMSMAKAREGLNLTSSGQVAAYFMEKLRHRETECVVVACVDAKGQLICERKLSEGSVNMSLISPREIFLAALESRAVNIVLVHNHPSGDPTPSRSDRELTRNVRDTGEKMGIRLLDHVIIGDNRYVSFRERAWFSEEPLYPEPEPA
nr:DNA repair protein RadC [uncultured Acetatifactor sp.]